MRGTVTFVMIGEALATRAAHCEDCLRLDAVCDLLQCADTAAGEPLSPALKPLRVQ